MATSRNRIGIVFYNNANWVGGVYYILNLLEAMNALPEAQKPEIWVYTHEKDYYFLCQNSTYPYKKFRDSDIKPLPLSQRIINKALRTLGQKDIFEPIPSSKEVRSIFPILVYGNDTGLESFYKNIPKKIQWIPDFQEHYLPHLFPADDVENRKLAQIRAAKAPYPIVFSSQDSCNDFFKFYPQAVCPTHVVNFAVTHPEYRSIEAQTLFQKFNLPQKYFFAPNQFWKHKNHIVVIEAVHLLKQKGVEITLAFSGKEHDPRNAGYTESLKAKVAEYGLEKNIRFLGFLDRREQLQLMNLAEAVVQPSLFEGWSTVVEDAKAMNQYVILSALNVHKEQLNYNVSFFEPTNAAQLADILEQGQLQGFQKVNHDYTNNVKKFAQDFLKIAL